MLPKSAFSNTRHVALPTKAIVAQLWPLRMLRRSKSAFMDRLHLCPAAELWSVCGWKVMTCRCTHKLSDMKIKGVKTRHYATAVIYAFCFY